MTDVIKIYRGIDELDGEDSLFAVRDDGMCLVVFAFFGDDHPWVLNDDCDFDDFYTQLFHGEFHKRCLNPTLVREVRK